MSFPYLAPIQSWVKEVLEYREANTTNMTYKMPYAVLASTALVIKGPVESNTEKRVSQLKDILKNKLNSSNVYRGCIIANNIDSSLNYQQSKTTVGIDFQGKAITVENETNRRVSAPIIESVEIDTDGANNTLKTAKMDIKCFTLKQFEMFELFFLKPGMGLFLEFGDSSLLRSSNLKIDSIPNKDRFNSVEDCIQSKNLNYDEFINLYMAVSAPRRENIKEYNNRIKKSLGTYDYVAGKVTDFSYTIDDQGIYSISLEISQGNQFTLAIPHNVGKAKAETSTGGKNVPKLDIFEQSKQLIATDLDITYEQLNNKMNSIKPGGKNTDWKNDFFNWGKLNVKQEDEAVSLKPYVSARFVFKILMNISADTDTFTFDMPEYSVNNTITEFIPVKSHKNILSSSEVILFPGIAPTLTIVEKDLNEIVFDKEKDFTIHGYSFNQDTNLNIKRYDKLSELVDASLSDAEKKLGYRIGNVLNCFLLYEEVVQIWKKSYTRQDFLEQILKLINENGYGLFELITASEQEGKKLTIIDYKFASGKELNVKQNENNIYRFKPTTIYSIVKNFSFNMELSNLVAGRSVFNAQKFISDTITKTKDSGSIKLSLEEKTLQSVDMAQYTSYDGYYAIDKVNYEIVLKNADKFIAQSSTGVTTQSAESGDETVTKETQIQKLINSKVRNFKNTNESKELLQLVFTDKSIIRGVLLKNISENTRIKSTLTPVEISLTIDGMSGFSCGEYFHIDGIPETYNRDGVFQITNVKHSIGSDGWNTAIEAGWRIIN